MMKRIVRVLSLEFRLKQSVACWEIVRAQSMMLHSSRQLRVCLFSKEWLGIAQSSTTVYVC